MKVSQVRDPSLVPLDRLPSSYKAKIAIVGCGPSSISCATFLGRLGYQNITIFERSDFSGNIYGSKNRFSHYKAVLAALRFLNIDFRMMLSILKFLS